MIAVQDMIEGQVLTNLTTALTSLDIQTVSTLAFVPMIEICEREKGREEQVDSLPDRGKYDGLILIFPLSSFIALHLYH